MQKDCIIVARAHRTLRLPDPGGTSRFPFSSVSTPSGQLFGRTLAAIARSSGGGRFSISPAPRAVHSRLKEFLG